MKNNSKQLTSPPLESLLQWYGQMWTIRYFEENAIDSFRKGLFGGSTHPSIGQEAIAVGAGNALRATDPLFATYRGHGHAIARGMDIKAMMAELLCKQSGCCLGRGGSMHLCDVSRDFWGTNAVVAAHLPIAGGMALAAKLRKTDAVTAVFFGDGATCEGVFFETLNMAALWKLPLIFVCENNGYAISVPTAKAIPDADVARRAQGFSLPGVAVDGNDPIAVWRAMSAAVFMARQGGGPTLIECKTTRWERHSAISAGKYDNEEEAMKWKKVDPIPRFAIALSAQGATEAQLEEIRERARQVNVAALEFAKASAPPSPQTVAEFVFA